jgi:ACT domain-containing protein
MLSTAIELCKSAIDIVFKNKEMRKDTKIRVGILLEEISKILTDTADKLSKDEYPHFNCALMEKMCDHLHFHITGVVPEEQLEELYNSLKEASQVEKQFAFRSEPNTIPSIYKAAGELKALGLLLKV